MISAGDKPYGASIIKSRSQNYMCGWGWINGKSVKKLKDWKRANPGKALPPKLADYLKQSQDFRRDGATCSAMVGDAIDKAVRGEPGKTKPLTPAQETAFEQQAIRAINFAWVDVGGRVRQRFGKPIDTRSERKIANSMIEKYVINPTARQKVSVYDVEKKKVWQLPYLGAIAKIAEIVRRGKVGGVDKVIILPPALTKEIKLINKIFPKRWAKHLVDQVGRMYVTTIRELKIGGVAPTAINYEVAAQKVVTRVRRMAWASVNKKQTVALAPATINDVKAEAQYKKIAKAEKKPAQRAIFKNFMTVVTETFVLRADQVTDPADATKKTVKITFRRAPIKGYIDGGYTKELTRTGPNSKPNFTFFSKITQTDTIRDQMTKSLKRLYPQAASMLTAKSAYDKNRKALDAKDSKNNTMIEKMTKATVKGMMKVFKDHYGLKGVGPNKVATVSKSDAAPMGLHELEAKDVILLEGSKNPDFVLFKLSHLKSTGGVPLTVIRTIIDGYPNGNPAIRAAAAIRRYQQAKDKLGDGVKDPAKLEKMTKTLVAQLKSVPDKKLMLSKVAKVAKDGTVTIKFAPKALYPYISTPKLLVHGGRYAKAKAKFTRAEVDSAELGLIDMVDRIKVIFDELADSNKSKLKEPGTRDALAEALKRHLVLKVFNNPKPLDGIGYLWTRTGKGGSFKIDPAKINVTKEVPAKDARGRVIPGQVRYKRVEKDGFKVTDVKLPNRFGGGGDVAKGIFWKKKYSSGLEVSVGGGVMAMYLRSLTNQTDEKNSGAGFANFNVNMKYKKFSAGFSAGIAGLKFEHQDATYDPEKPIIHAPHQSVGGFQDVGGMVSAHAGVDITKKIKISAKGGIIGSKPSGFSGRPFKLDMHTGALPYLAPILLGGGVQLSLAASRYSAGVYFKGGKPTIPSFNAKAAWSDGMLIGAGAHGRFHINRNFAISAAYGFGLQKGGKKTGADGALKLTPLSQHSVMAGLNVNLLKKRLLLDLAYRGVFQKADQATGLQSAGEHTVSFSAMGLLSKNFALFGSASYTRRSDKILFPSSGNTINPGALNSEIVKEGPGWTLGASFYTSSNTWLSAFYTGGRIVNRDIDGLKAHHAIGFLFGWAYDGHKALQSGDGS